MFLSSTVFLTYKVPEPEKKPFERTPVPLKEEVTPQKGTCSVPWVLKSALYHRPLSPIVNIQFLLSSLCVFLVTYLHVCLVAYDFCFPLAMISG